MKTGRIETYTHSDSTTDNKGAAIVKVICDTDFAARTEPFKAFAHDVAKFAYGALARRGSPYFAGPDLWATIIELYPHLEIERQTVERELQETVKVTEFVILRL